MTAPEDGPAAPLCVDCGHAKTAHVTHVDGIPVNEIRGKQVGEFCLSCEWKFADHIFRAPPPSAASGASVERAWDGYALAIVSAYLGHRHGARIEKQARAEVEAALRAEWAGDRVRPL